jgi:hypothetical protein
MCTRSGRAQGEKFLDAWKFLEEVLGEEVLGKFLDIHL